MVNCVLKPVVGEHPLSRVDLTAGLEAFTDPRIDRYWQLTATVNGWPRCPSYLSGSVWLLAALHAHP